MLITLNELGKFLYKMINEFMAFLNKKWQKYVLKYWCFKSAPKKPPPKPSLRKKYSNPSEARHVSQKWKIYSKKKRKFIRHKRKLNENTRISSRIKDLHKKK